MQILNSKCVEKEIKKHVTENILTGKMKEEIIDLRNAGQIK